MKTAGATHSQASRRGGHAVVEMTFVMPWIFFLFAGAFDMGFYARALVATTNAARAAALYASSSALNADDSAGACTYALTELSGMPNARNLTGCSALPLIVTATPVTDLAGNAATQVSVQYRTPALIPIPGLTGQLTITRRVQMKL